MCSSRQLRSYPANRGRGRGKESHLLDLIHVGQLFAMKERGICMVESRCCDGVGFAGRLSLSDKPDRDAVGKQVGKRTNGFWV